MMITGSIGLVLTLMSIVVLWENFSTATVTWFVYLHVFPSIMYGLVVLHPEPSWDSSSLDFCDYSVCVFAFVSVFIMPVFLIAAFCIAAGLRGYPE